MSPKSMRWIKKIYCINLDRRPDRWKQAESEFKKHNLQVERISAIDGHAIPEKKKLELKPGLYGCTRSHYLLISEAKYLHLRTIMVFEDDVELHPEFSEKLEFVLADLPDNWDMLMLGGSHREPPSPLPGCNYMRVNKTLTSHGYIIHHTLYDRLLDKLRPMDTPIDCAFAELQPTSHVFISDPPLAWQRDGYSDIENRNMSYPWIKTNDQ